MNDRRKLERSHLIHYLRLLNRDSDELIGNLVDITPEGIMFISDRRFSSGDLLHLRMEFPEELFNKEHLELEAQVVWCSIDQNPDLFAVGIRLIQLDPQDQTLIYDLIKEYQDAPEDIYHITTREAWEYARQIGNYRPAGFDAEGFIHCSTEAQVIQVANRIFRHATDLILLEINPARVLPTIVWENLEGGEELFPHIYGPLSPIAVRKVFDLPPDAEGYFHFPKYQG